METENSPADVHNPLIGAGVLLSRGTVVAA
jgi:hypothetical protein